MPNGMFGTIIVGQPPVPGDVAIAQRIPMVLNDSGTIGFSLNGKSFPATAPIVANAGDWVLIDYFNEGSQYHPMHLHQFDQVVVAEDGFAVPQPYTVDTLNVGPGNRFTVLVHLDKPGTWVWHCHILPHVESDSGMFGMVTAVVVK
jgi:FtsP/CotA-like multicopper oxidase with cupredoxin domain